MATPGGRSTLTPAPMLRAARGLRQDLTPPTRSPWALTAYRIVPEALTNAVRHSGARSVTVVVRPEHGSLLVEVTDAGPGPPPADAGSGLGFGLVGMRERADALGGTLNAGPVTHRGYRITATLPAG